MAEGKAIESIDQGVLADTKAMIDGLKTVCANAGLANDSSEYKIITEAFLYKFLNDRFLHELRASGGLGEDAEAAYSAMDENSRERLLAHLDPTVAIIRPEYLLSYLFNRKDKSGKGAFDGKLADATHFHEAFDGALNGIADDNVDIFSVQAQAKASRYALLTACRASS
jgi:type I restriction enzyme M protein